MIEILQANEFPTKFLNCSDLKQYIIYLLKVQILPKE